MRLSDLPLYALYHRLNVKQRIFRLEFIVTNQTSLQQRTKTVAIETISSEAFDYRLQSLMKTTQMFGGRCRFMVLIAGKPVASRVPRDLVDIHLKRTVKRLYKQVGNDL